MKLTWKTALCTLAPAMVLLTAGCGSPTFKNVYSTSDEIKMGQEASDEIDSEAKIDMNVQDNTRVQDVAQPIFDQARKIRPDLPYQIRIIDDPTVNAFSLPGGFIYIYKGLLDKLGNDDDALAGVIGHETAHAVRRHVVKQMSDSGVKGTLLEILGMSTTNYNVYNAAGLAYQLDQLHFSRQDEYEADKYGLMFAYNAGYDPNGMNRMFKKLEDLEKVTGSEPAYAEDHPITKNRELRVIDLEKELRDNDGHYPDDPSTYNGEKPTAKPVQAVAGQTATPQANVTAGQPAPPTTQPVPNAGSAPSTPSAPASGVAPAATTNSATSVANNK